MQSLDFRKISKLQEQRRTIRSDKLQGPQTATSVRSVDSGIFKESSERIVYESDWIGSHGSHKSDSLNRKPPPSRSLRNNKEFLHIIFNTYKNLFSQDIYIHFSTVNTNDTMLGCHGHCVTHCARTQRNHWIDIANRFFKINCLKVNFSIWKASFSRHKAELFSRHC